MDNRHSIGSKIQKYRKLKDMTQDELSKQSGIYLSTIKKYESGERNPKPVSYTHLTLPTNSRV